MLGEFITRCLILLLGYAYPGFECYKTVERRNRVDIEELRFWCQYWIIVAMFTVLEKFADVFIGWLPLYGEMKLALFIYLWYPKTKGTGYVYDAVLRPYVSRHENDIDKKFQEFRVRAWDLAIFYWKHCTELGSTTFFQVLDYLAGQSARFSNKSTTKTKKKGNEGQNRPTPSAPPLPSLREALFENNTIPAQNGPISRPVNFRLDPKTGYLQEDDAWDPFREEEFGPEDHRGKPNGIGARLRRLRK